MALASIAEQAFLSRELFGIDISLAQIGREPMAEVIDFAEAAARLRSAPNGGL
jgi:hypothetical protein